jgi:hypothetical protein
MEVNHGMLWTEPDRLRHRRRGAIRASRPAWTGHDARSDPPPPQAADGGVRLRFTEQARVRVRGPVSGADYVFSASEPVVSVAAADAEGLLRTRYFRRAF